MLVYLVIYHWVPFLRATNFTDFMDIGTSMKFVSPKISGNSIMTRIHCGLQTEKNTTIFLTCIYRT